jgi:hypothetical protein
MHRKLLSTDVLCLAGRMSGFPLDETFTYHTKR